MGYQLLKKSEFTDPPNSCFLPEFLFTDLRGKVCDLDELALKEAVNKRAKRWRSSAFMFLRNPPHVFGTGYAQALATEMSDELYKERLATLLAAFDNLGKKQSVELVSKGVHFGRYGVTITPKDTTAGLTIDLMRQPNYSDFLKFDPIGDIGPVKGFEITEECSVGSSSPTEGTSCMLDGISRDLIVRPFQWKGIASDERNFVRDALNFHFGVQDLERPCGRRRR